MIACPHCKRGNPAGALFCFNDGSPLGSARVDDPARRRFPAPFVFPSGRATWTFDELARACLDDWHSAVELHQTGALAAFLGGLGRHDLAAQARATAGFPDADRALARLLEELPVRELPAARLVVQPERFDLGRLRVGTDVRLELRLLNEGHGFLYGSVAGTAPWLVVGEGDGVPSKLFGCHEEIVLPVRVRGAALRAAVQPQEARLVIESSGGTVEVPFRVEVPPVTFAAGVLAGARTPRQLVERAWGAPQEAARLFESGAVARWYRDNGWTYPVRGEPGRGLAAVEQFFDALGLTGKAKCIPGDAPSAGSRPWLPAAAGGKGSSAETRPDVTAGQARQAPAAIDWLPPSPPAPPEPDQAEALDWLPITRPVASPPVPRPSERRSISTGVWLLLLPVLLLGLAGLAVALSLPRRATPGPADDTSRPAAPTVIKVEKPPPPPKESEGAPGLSAIPDEPAPPRRFPRPPAPPQLAMREYVTREVEIVFCLDTTGSMGGLLRGAQDKIWSICNQVAGGKPVPSLKVGLVAYRDRGDDYVTRVFDLSRNLDVMHQDLRSLSAGGGGDTPESVNQALDNAVNRIKWSTDRKTLRMIFLVGDAPPHMDYKDDVKYPDTCKKAVEKGILINTIQCGKDDDCRRHWKEIAAKAGGEFVAIPQAGGVRIVATPFDDELAGIAGKLMDTALIYGNAAQKQLGERMLKVAKMLRGPAAADRAAFAAKSKRINPCDLLDDIQARAVKLENVKPDDLPDSLGKLGTLAERRAKLEKVAAMRAELQKQALELERKRAEHIKNVLAGDPDAVSFDAQVLAILRKQAKKFDIAY